MTLIPPPSPLQGLGLRLSYGDRIIVPNLSVSVPPQQLTVIIGPNGCGKSTLLHAFSRGLMPSAGHILLNQQDLHRQPGKQVAKQLALLAQNSTVAEHLTVYDLVSRGRYPHQSFFKQWSEADEVAVTAALVAAQLQDLQHELLSALSGGQRQRAWLAMALAQQSDLLLLDEPTTYLDIAHQVDVLDLCLRLKDGGKTIVMVLHDLNQALRYADYLILMKQGDIIKLGRPEDIITAANIEAVFGLACRIITDPESGKPLVIPKRNINTVETARRMV